jgi:TRAP-type C4-dicarboxylate transport system substrate-binding protein
MNKLFILLMVSLVTVSLATPANPASPTSVIKLNLADFFPPTHTHSILITQWAKEIEKRTDGRVRISYYPGGTLVPKNIYDATVTGITDIGFAASGDVAGRYPACGVFGLPNAWPDSWVPTMLVSDFIEHFNPVELQDVHLLFADSVSAPCVLTAKKPVRKIEDLKGLIIRATGDGATLMKSIGTQVYGAPISDVYELLSKGVVEGVFTCPEALKGWKFADVVSYITMTRGASYIAPMWAVMNKGKWNSLPPDIKTIFTEVSKEWGSKYAMLWAHIDQEGLEYFNSLKNKEVIQLSSDELARWRKAMQPVRDNYITDKTKMGLPVNQYLAYLDQRIPYWAAKAPSASTVSSWYKSYLQPLLISK